MSMTALERRRVRASRSGRLEAARPDIEETEVDAGTGVHSDGQAVAVVGAHPWAGASTVALALADAATRRAARVVLVDLAGRDSSGLVAVTDREFGPRGDGWSVGRRGPVAVFRTSYTQATADLAPWSPEADVVVVDRGRCAEDQSACLGDLDERLQLVLVCRATIPGVRAVEIVLSRLGRDDVLLAAVGARRLAGVVKAAAGPGVARLLREQRLVCVPHVRRLDVEGLDDRPLPTALIFCANQLWGLLSAESRSRNRKVGV